MESELARVQHALAALEDARHEGESELTEVQHPLAASEEARRKAEDEANRLADERVSLLIDLGLAKTGFPLSRQRLLKRKALDEAFDAGFDVIFNYSYGCCAFTQNICGSEPMIPYRMSDTSKPLPPKFFINPRCPLGAALGFLPPIQMQMLERRARVFQPPRLG